MSRILIWILQVLGIIEYMMWYVKIIIGKGDDIIEALQNCKISKRRVCVKWWKLGQWFYGFYMLDESHSRWVSLVDLAMAKEHEVLVVLQRGGSSCRASARSLASARPNIGVKKKLKKVNNI
jgi:hypothetical protein